MRTLRRVLSVAALLAAGVTVAPAARADEPPPDVDSKTLRAAEKAFKADFASVDIELKLQSVARFARHQHPSVAKALIKLFKDEDPYVRAAAAKGLAHQLSSVKAAGSKLAKLATENGEEPRVLVAAVRTLGALDYRKALDELTGLMRHDDDDVVIAVFDVLGGWKETEALDDMRKWFEQWPDEKGFVTVSASVDTGAAGDRDQRAAEALGRGMLAAHKSWRPRPECTDALRKALKEITGKGFRRPEDLRRYLDDRPERYRDPEEVAQRVDEAARRAIFQEWHAAKASATEYAGKQVPGDSPEDGEKRAKAYGKELYELRRKMLEKHGLLLSELDVIVEEGEAAEWPTGQRE